MENQDNELKDKARTIIPWFISFIVHLLIVILATTIVWQVAVHSSRKQPVEPMVDPRTDEGEDFTDPKDGITGLIDVTTGQGGGSPNIPDPEYKLTPPTTPTNKTNVNLKNNKVIEIYSPIPMTGIHHGTGNDIFHDIDGGGTNGDKDHGIGTKGGSARSIVFVVDASGSMVDTMPFVVDALNTLIEAKLTEKKSFSIIFFGGKGITSMSNRGIATYSKTLLVANTANKSAAKGWIDKIEVGGSGDALAAIKMALDMKPEMIQVLSSNLTNEGIWELQQDKFMEEFNKYYKQTCKEEKRRIAFKTIQYVYPDKLTIYGMEPTLKRIIKDTNGNPDTDYKFVSSRDLGIR